jgi:hypothetical protein
MKVRVSAKELRERFKGRTITLGTFSPNYLIAYNSPDYYTCGVYGWNFDALVFGNTLILWGDRGTFGKLADYDRIQFYENKAKEIYGHLYKDYSQEEVMRKLDSLLKDFIGETLKE